MLFREDFDVVGKWLCDVGFDVLNVEVNVVCCCGVYGV